MGEQGFSASPKGAQRKRTRYPVQVSLMLQRSVGYIMARLTPG